MKRTACGISVVALVFGAAFAGGGCGSPSPTPGGVDLETRLAKDTGVTWLVDRDEAGLPKLMTALSPPPPLSSAVPREQAAIAFLQRYADLLGARDLPSELVLVEDFEDRLLTGSHHLRFAQRIPGSDVRVRGSDTFVHLDPSNAVRFVAVGFVKAIQAISAQPVTTADEASAANAAMLRARDPQAEILPLRPPVLVARREADGSGKLAWYVTARARVHGAIEAPAAFVDAQDGTILESADTSAEASFTTDASNFYAYHDSCGAEVPAGTSTITYETELTTPIAALPVNRLLRDGDNQHSTIITDQYLGASPISGELFTAPIVATDPRAFDFLPGTQGSGAAISTHVNVGLTDTFFRSLGQLGWDRTATIPITAAVHAWEPAPSSTKPLKARGRTVFSGDVIYFRDGFSPDGLLVSSPTCDAFPDGVAIDVVAHEFTHGVAEHFSHPLHKGEAGALQEAIADALAAATEHSLYPSDDNFISGESSRIKTKGTRSMRSPRSFPSQFPNELVPRAYSERLSMTDLDKDLGHVHDNSLIGSHAFFLMTAGGTNEVSHISVTPEQALDWDRATFLWYLTLRSLDTRVGTTFHDFARAQIILAEMYAATFFPNATAAVGCAWRAVEVFTDAELKPYGVTCASAAPAPAPSGPPGGSSTNPPDGCAGHGDHLVCDPAAPSSALVCRGGVRVDVALCADLGQRCKPASDTDPTADVDTDGALVCE